MSAARTGSRRRFLVTATPPTTNGDLHVGHLSGPYLAADVFCRAQRLRGHETVYVSGGDDHQTYVVTTAERLGMDPRALAERSNSEIRETLTLAGIAIDAFPSPSPEYIECVQSFFADLFRRGKLARRRLRMPWCPEKRRFLVEAYAQGFCPECYAATCGAICEDCGHPNDVGSLLFARSSGASPAEAELREVDVLVLPLEAHRERLRAFYERTGATMRPHVLRFVAEMLEQPLRDFPVTYPGEWGIPVAIPGFEGQVWNVWAEMLPGLVHMTGAGLAATARADERPWARGSGWELVQFMGYDNTFYFSFAHLGLLLAHEAWIEPTAIVTNEFYHLDNSKFSTSRRHLIWARDLVGRFGVDNVRFYLALGNPEHQPANFTEKEFVQTIAARLHAPIVRLAEELAPHAGHRVAVEAGVHSLFGAFRRRMDRAYELSTFSLRQAAETTANLLAMLRDVAGRDHGASGAARAALGLAYLASHASPLVPRLAGELWSQLGLAGEIEVGRAAALSEVVVPALDPARLLGTQL